LGRIKISGRLCSSRNKRPFSACERITFLPVNAIDAGSGSASSCCLAVRPIQQGHRGGKRAARSCRTIRCTINLPLSMVKIRPWLSGRFVLAQFPGGLEKLPSP
jgi:hypothetical protein